ncbi:MAG: hypothetical protein QNJ15_14255 [Erythrobacter sp.]|nr:hypothetical protein [Erythrobacter sp.]
MVKRNPKLMVIDGEAREVDNRRDVSEVIPKEATAITTADGRTFARDKLSDMSLEDLQARGFVTHQSDIVRACRTSGISERE